jgi:GDPmannose 4,6-dehydratase
VKNYREAYNLFACNGILFNHSSPRRGHNFIEKKVVMGLKKILSEPSEILTVGNLNAKRDIGHARDYVEGMWRMLQHSQPDDYILATGETHSVREIIETAFQLKGIYIEWRGEGVNEVGVDVRTGRTVVNVSARYYRPTEVDLLLGDPSKARNILGWAPRIYFHQLIQDMIDNEFM